MPFCHPDQIIVPAGRFRTPTTQQIESIAESIKETGQLQPILVSKTPVMVSSLEKGQLELVDGLTRLLAAKKVDKEVWWEDDITGKLKLDNPIQRRRAEIQANLKRHEFTPAELNAGITELHHLMIQTYGKKKPGQTDEEGWTQTDTAKMLGLKSHASVGAALAITEAAAVIPAIKNAKTTNEALKMVKDLSKIEAQKELARRAGEKPTAEISDPKKFFGDKIILGDCLKGLGELPDGICGLFITDPPWKIDMDQSADNHNSIIQKVAGNYDDSSEDILPLLENVIQEMWRVAKPDCWAVMFCGARHFNQLYDKFREVGFAVLSCPLVWVKIREYGTDKLNKVACAAPAIWPSVATDFMILARKGSPLLFECGKSNVFLHPPTTPQERFHQAQKPIRLMEEIISRFYHPGTNPLLIDPFAGSGSTLVAARRLGLKQYFGFELDPEFRERAVSYLINSWMADQGAKAEIEVQTGLVVDPGEFE